MTAQTQTAHIIALYFGLVPEKYREKTAAALVRLLEKENGHLVTGFVGTPYFCHALSANGYLKQAYELLLKDDFPSWLYQVKMGPQPYGNIGTVYVRTELCGARI